MTINQQSVNPLPTHPEWEFPNAEPTPPDNPADGGGTVQHCVVVDWPGKSMWPTMERKSTWYYTESWVGSLLLHSRDPSGQYYRRNRFYDGSSGRFTQEDPIGIAGGLNVYGYANGDPITYSDPYGLSAQACCVLGTTELGDRILQAAEAPRHLVGTARDFLRNYQNMRQAGRELVEAGHSAEGNDKYFHCRANCDASRRGRVGRFASRIISDVREAYDQTVKDDPAEASEADQEAN